MATRYGCRMRRDSTVFLIASLLLLPWLAASTANGQPNQGGDLPVIVTLDAADCRRILARAGTGTLLHQPADDVAYRPGRDVDSSGRPVAPADLPVTNPLPLGPIELPINITLTELLGSRAPPRVGVSELNVARVSIDPMSGKVAFNGQPLEPRGEDAVASACRQYLAGPRR
jgi:hypothetical protein